MAWGVLVSLCATCTGHAEATHSITYRPVIEGKAKPAISAFDLSDVRLLDGPFKHAMDLDHDYLLSLEPDRFLARFRTESGLQPRAEGYGGWEAETISGHSLGHYLSALALMYRATGDQRLLDRANYVVDELAACQRATGNGYVAAIPRGQEILSHVSKGDIRSKGFDLNGLWAPYYTLHKELAGLRDAYRLCGNPKALDVSRGLADWIDRSLSGLSHDQMQSVLACEHGGMNEVLADLYADTGDPRYLTLSRRFHHDDVLAPLARGEDILPGRHGNTNIPKLIGLAVRYELTGESSDRAAAEFFWERVVDHHSYVNGGHGINEYFGPADRLNDRLGPNTAETCNVYNMLKLTEHVLEWNGDARAGDFYERALYNHILASQHPVDGRVVYFLSLAMGYYKEFQSLFEDFTCCVGTGMENHAKYGEAIYFHSGDTLYVNLFIPSEVDWHEKGVLLRQETRFPDEEVTRLTLRTRAPVHLTLRIRHPHWVETGLVVRVNGKPVDVKTSPSSWIEIEREWKSGDQVEMTLPLARRLESMPDNPNRVALLSGPILLAGDLGAIDDPASSRPDYVPVLVSDQTAPQAWVRPAAGLPLQCSIEGIGKPRDLELVPFFALHDRRYSVYFDRFTVSEWRQKEPEYKVAVERVRQLEADTVDFFQPGEMQPERDHKLQGEKTEPGEMFGRKSRAANDGWFSFEMKTLPDQPVSLIATYWGNERGSRTFDILVDEQLIATQTLLDDRPGHFFDVTYDLPASMTRGKTAVTVTFRARPQNVAGGLYGARIVKAAIE